MFARLSPLRRHRLLLIVSVVVSVTVAACDGTESAPESPQFVEGLPVSGTALDVPLTPVGDFGRRPKFTPDGTGIALFGREGQAELRVLDLSSGRVDSIVLPAFADDYDWSPDGTRLAVDAGAQIHLVDRDGSGLRALTTTNRNVQPAWSPTGDRLAFTRTICADPPSPPECGLYVASVAGDEISNVIPFRAEPAWHPDGERIFVRVPRPETNDEAIGVYSLASDTETVLPLNHPDVRSIEVSPDGRRLAYETDSGVWVAAADGAWAHRILPKDLNDAREGDVSLQASTPSWHPDGDRLVYDLFRVDRYEPGAEPMVSGRLTLHVVDVDSALAASEARTP